METYALNPLVELYPFETNKINVFHRGTGKSYTLGEKESAVVRLLDGSRTLAEIRRACPFFNAEELQGLMAAFSKIGLLAGTGERKKQPFYKLKLRLFNPNRVLKPNGVLTGLTTCLTYLSPVICIGAAFYNVLARSYGWVDPVPADQILEALGTLGLPMYGLLALAAFLSLAAHEFAHAAVARHYRVNVPEIGVMLYLLMPCAYTNLSGIRLLKSRGKRIMTLLAGSLANANIIAGCVIALMVVPDPRWCAFLVGLVVANLCTIGLNCVMFLKFDAYFIVEVLLDESSLKEKAIGFLSTWCKAVFGRNAQARQTLAAVRSEEGGQLKTTLYAVYGLVSIFYVPVFLAQAVLVFFMG